MKIKASKAPFTCDETFEAFCEAEGLHGSNLKAHAAPANAARTLKSCEHRITACLVGSSWVLFNELSELEAKLWKKMRRGF
jgi:hypothetical protein